MERITSPEDFIQRCWDLLFQATVKRGKPFATPVVGTVADGECRMRTVILRKVEIQERRLLFFTDARSPKVEQLSAGDRLSWHFYDPKKGLQIRAHGVAVLHLEDEVARRFWLEQPVVSRKNYASEKAPGVAVAEATEGLPSFWREELSQEETDFAFPRFVAVYCTIDYMDCLHLHTAGHQRAIFRWQEEKWEGGWVIP